MGRRCRLTNAVEAVSRELRGDAASFVQEFSCCHRDLCIPHSSLIIAHHRSSRRAKTLAWSPRSGKAFN